MTAPHTAADLIGELEVLVQSRYGVIVLDTPDERRALQVAEGLSARVGLPFFQWSASAGLRRPSQSEPANTASRDPAQALRDITAQGAEGIYFFPVMGAWIDDATVQAQLHDCAQLFLRRPGAIILQAEGLVLGPALARDAAIVRPPPLDREAYRDVLRRLVRDLAPRVDLRPEQTDELLESLRGLTLDEARRVLARLIVTDGVLDASDIPRAASARLERVQHDGLLEYHAPGEAVPELAGLDALKAWLAKRHRVLTQPDRAAKFGLPFPRGLLLVGVPGCGKSLCARTVAAEWKLPLLRLDIGRLYNRFVGESERNFRQAIGAVERVAPAVLWIDELEKAFTAEGDGADGGLSRRLLGALLTWMQDRTEPVFLVATANDVTRLPPELIRKGRFDEIFFLDLPTPDERAAIFAAQLRRRGQELEWFDLRELALRSDGFSGAEIEQAVVSGLYGAFDAGVPLTQPQLLQELGTSRTLAMTAPERIAALRAWGRERAVPASGVPA